MEKRECRSQDETANEPVLSHEEMQQEELRLLRAFDAFCKKHELKYSLAGGTLLGAVRHKGFIPWDDDIDLNMPRPDWDALIGLRDDLFECTGLRVIPYFGSDIDATPLVKLVNPQIKVQSDSERESSYLWMDILPVDGLPTSLAVTKRVYRHAKCLRRVLAVAVSTAESGHSPLRRLFKRLVGPILRAFDAQRLLGARLDRYSRSIPYGSTPYVGGVAWGMYGAGERVPLEGFENLVSLEFEGQQFSCMSCWDEYLHGLYGDYMQLPPADKRVTHEIRAWYVN